MYNYRNNKRDMITLFFLNLAVVAISYYLELHTKYYDNRRIVSGKTKLDATTKWLMRFVK